VVAAFVPERARNQGSGGRSTDLGSERAESLCLLPEAAHHNCTRRRPARSTYPVVSCRAFPFFDHAKTTTHDIDMSAAKLMSSANVTPVSTPPGPQPSDGRVRTLLAKRAARIDELELENADLQDRLDEALSRIEHNHGVKTRPETIVATENETADALALLQRQYQDLEARHKKLQADYAWREKYMGAAKRKYEAAKLNAQQWQAYLNKHSEKREVGSDPLLPHPPPPVPREVSDLDITPKPLRRASPEISDIASNGTVANEPRAKSFKHVEASSAVNESTRSPGSISQSKRITSSQTTVDDQTEVGSSPTKIEARSDEEPVVVSERVLRRRRNGSASAMPPPRRIKEEPVSSPQRPGSAKEPIELRSEECSSPAIRARSFIRTESSDLDAIRGTYQTPRKRRLRDESRSRSEEPSEAISHPPRTPAQDSSSLSDSDIPDLPTLPVAFERAQNLTSIRQPIFSKQSTTSKERSYNRQRGALGQLSPNVPTMPQTARKRRRISEEDAGKVGILAEDGDENDSQVAPKAETGTAKIPANHRLAAMLENPTPGRQPLNTRRPAAEMTKRPRPQRPQHQNEPTSHTKPAPPTCRYQRPPGIEKSPPPIDPESEFLRSKPLKHLRPQDFRINPSFANSDHAFVDPMNRKTKAARRCLPGCINQSCCGEFLDAARHGLLPPSSKSDVQVIEDVFGASHAEIMAAYPPSQHAEVLIRARAQDFANEHGRHRKTFERAPTPPGFWRTAMPSTQEELEDKKKAEDIERMKVEGMWLEATRGDGRWKFRDE
jgi:hypothetical protein